MNRSIPCACSYSLKPLSLPNLTPNHPKMACPTLRLILIRFACILAVHGAPILPEQTAPGKSAGSSWTKEEVITLLGIFVAIVAIFVMVFFASPSVRNWFTRKKLPHEAFHAPLIGTKAALRANNKTQCERNGTNT